MDISIVRCETVSEAIVPLLRWLQHPDSDLRYAIIGFLAELGEGRAEEALRSSLQDVDAEVRRAALQALAQSLDETDRRLLTQDLGGWFPWRDPQEPIDESLLGRATEWLKLPAEEVRTRYKALAERFGLRLAFARETTAKPEST